MTFSLIIVNYHNAPLLRLSLTSLARALGREADYEVIVVDSETSPETQNVVRHDCADLFDRLLLVPFRENTGYTRGVNEGIKRATGEWYLILNPDIIVLPGTVQGMLEYLREHPQVGLLGPGLLNFDDTRQDSCFRFYTPLTMPARRLGLWGTGRLVKRFLMRDHHLDGPTPADWLMGSALLASRQAVQNVGLMDERFFLYLSEVDWAYRFWENGYQVVYYPNVQMYHYHQRQSKGRLGILDILFKRETRWHIADAIRYFRKHGTSGRRPSGTATVQPQLIST